MAAVQVDQAPSAHSREQKAVADALLRKNEGIMTNILGIGTDMWVTSSLLTRFEEILGICM